MQDQITQLSASIRSIVSSEHSPGGVSASGTYGQLLTQRPIRRLSTARETSFQGPTTSAFSFDLAKSSLQQRGIVERAEVCDEGDMTQEPSPLASPSAANEELEIETRQTLDPLWILPKAEALRLCRVYEEEMGVMYPVLELSELLDQVDLLYGQKDGVLGPTDQPDGHNGLSREDVHILRVVFACALTAEASGRSEQAIALFDSVREVQDNCVWGPPEIKNIIFLTLVVCHAQSTMDARTVLIVSIVNILFSNGRGNPGVAHRWYCGAHVPRERSSSTGNSESTGHHRRGEGSRPATLLVYLYFGYAVELWDWHAICSGRYRY